MEFLRNASNHSWFLEFLRNASNHSWHEWFLEFLRNASNRYAVSGVPCTFWSAMYFLECHVLSGVDSGVPTERQQPLVVSGVPTERQQPLVARVVSGVPTERQQPLRGFWSAR